MKRKSSKINHQKNSSDYDLKDLGYEDYAELFQEGMSDSEISHELGVDEKYIKGLRKEYQNDY